MVVQASAWGIRPSWDPKAFCACEGCCPGCLPAALWPQPECSWSSEHPREQYLPFLYLLRSQKPWLHLGELTVQLWDSLLMWTVKNRRAEELKGWPEKKPVRVAWRAFGGSFVGKWRRSGSGQIYLAQPMTVLESGSQSKIYPWKPKTKKVISMWCLAPVWSLLLWASVWVNESECWSVTEACVVLPRTQYTAFLIMPWTSIVIFWKMTLWSWRRPDSWPRTQGLIFIDVTANIKQENGDRCVISKIRKTKMHSDRLNLPPFLLLKNDKKYSCF